MTGGWRASDAHDASESQATAAPVRSHYATRRGTFTATFLLARPAALEMEGDAAGRFVPTG